MTVTSALQQLKAGLQGTVRAAEPMARHTTYRIGGPVGLFVVADSVADLKLAIAVCADEGIDWTVLGKGSNILVADAGYDGMVIVLGRAFKRHAFDGDCINTGAGVALAHVVQESFSKGMSGLEFAVGIPGTVGGAVAMNAGARDDWIGSRVECVTLFVPGVGLTRVRGHEVLWGYRRSGLSDRGVIVETSLRVEVGDVTSIRRTMEASLRRRKACQPVGIPSAGSVFVNPEGDSAGRLIEGAGMKGARIGGAQVSEIHANFIVNTGGARAMDVAELMVTVRSAVKDQYGIELRPEIRFLGSFDVS